MNTKKKIAIFILIIFFSLIPFLQVKAFSVSPLKYNVSIEPGGSRDMVIEVFNDSAVDKDFKPDVIGLLQDKYGQAIFKSSSDVAESWVVYEGKNQLIKSGQKKDFIFTINIPKNAPPGAHYLGLGVQEISGQNISGKIETILILQVSGKATESLLLKNFLISKKINLKNKFNYLIQLRNLGNIDLSTKGEIKIYNLFDRIIDSKSVDTGNKIFAQTDRDINFSDYNNKIIFPGKYKAVLFINYGITNQQIIAGADFWYIPLWFIGIIFTIIIIIILIKKNHENVE